MKRLVFLSVILSLIFANSRMSANVDNVEYFQEINKALMAQDVPKAEKLMAQWEKEDPDNADLYIAKAIIDENSPSPNLEKQSEYYEKAMSLRPDRIDYPMHYVEGLVAVGEVDRALKIIDRLLRAGSTIYVNGRAAYRGAIFGRRRRSVRTYMTDEQDGKRP